MRRFSKYLDQIKEREKIDISPKPIVNGEPLKEIITNILYLERPGCNLCVGNQEKTEKGYTVTSTSTRLFKGRVVKDSDRKKGESLLSSTPVFILSSIFAQTPTLEEY